MRGVVVATLMVVMLAGCAAESSPQVEEVPAAFEDIQVSSTKGAIRGLVLSETITPIEGAEVKLTGTDQVKVSDAQGAFVFVDLDAGDYFLSVSKPGYFGVQASTTVVAGLSNPPIVKVQLVIDAENQPFTELLQWAGFFGCGAGTNGAGGPVGGSVNPCAADAIACEFFDVCLMNTGNVYEFPFGVARVPDFAQAEMVWTGTQPLGNYMNLGWYDEGVSDFKGASGESPLVVPATREEIVSAHSENITALTVRVFPGSNQELTVTMQQRFDVYVTYFYGFTPREGWAFSADGACTSPAQCA